MAQPASRRARVKNVYVRMRARPSRPSRMHVPYLRDIGRETAHHRCWNQVPGLSRRAATDAHTRRATHRHTGVRCRTFAHVAGEPSARKPRCSSITPGHPHGPSQLHIRHWRLRGRIACTVRPARLASWLCLTIVSKTKGFYVIPRLSCQFDQRQCAPPSVLSAHSGRLCVARYGRY